jgi:dihydropteroate synthase
VGGESTRPGALAVPLDEELRRVLPVVEALVARGLPAAISVDTSKAEVARRACAAGAHVINDVTSLADPGMAEVAVEHGAVVILMHMRGTPRTMQTDPTYGDVVAEVRAALAASRDRAVAAGIAPERIWLDPGLGFGKTGAHNLSLTRHLDALVALGHPVVYAASRKAFLGHLTGKPPAERDAATAAACVAAVLAGAHVLRVHDVAAVTDALSVAAAVRRAH